MSRLCFCLAFLAAVGVALVAVPDQSAAPVPKRPLADRFPEGPYFVIGCGFSHRNNDDAIVFPGQPGRSHNHTYIGNRSVDASSTPASLRGGETTCREDGDSSAYWVPTLFAGREPVRPLAGVVYYVRRTSAPVEPLPAGLKIVAGNADARRPQPLDVASWSCGGFARARRSPTLPACTEDEVVQLRVNFPNCWSGRSLDSADHRQHMAYASGGRCPASHSVAVPTITLLLFFPPLGRETAQVSSGRFAVHADFINGWDQDALARHVAALN